METRPAGPRTKEGEKWDIPGFSRIGAERTGGAGRPDSPNLCFRETPFRKVEEENDHLFF